MAFGLPSTSTTGPFLGRLQYDSSEGLWTVVHRVQQPDGRYADEKGNPFRWPLPSFLLDFGSIEVGFLKYYPTPEFRLVPYGQTLPEAPQEMGTSQDGKPTKAFRPGFRIKIASKKLFSDLDAYWFSNTANGVLNTIDALHNEFLKAPEAARGQIPLVTCTAVHEGRMSYGKVYTPEFAITRWMDRIEAFGPRTVPPPAAKGVTAAPQMTAAASGAAHTRAQGAAAGAAYAAAQPAAAIPPNDDDWEMPPPGSGPAEHVPAPAGDIEDDIPF